VAGLALDHVVIAVSELEAAMADYRALGFTVVAGGSHPGRTSHNALVVFADGSYLELIAWESPNPAERWFKHMDGDTSALPAKTELNDQGVQRNLATMQSWQFSVTPMIVYRGKDNSVKLVRGNPKDLAAFVNDLGARS